MISHKHAFIFVHVGRTGGSSLERLAGADITRDPRTQLSGNTDFHGKHFTFAEYYNLYPTEFSDYYKFTIIRNPYERLVSAWCWRRNIVKDFAGSLTEFALTVPEKWTFRSRLKLDHLSFGESIETFDFIARYENIGKDLRTIASKTGLDISKYPHINKTDHEAYIKYYDDQTLALTTERFKFDIDYFNYQFGG